MLTSRVKAVAPGASRTGANDTGGRRAAAPARCKARRRTLAMHPDHPLRIVGLDHVVLRCARLDATMAFYVEVLGCTLERELPELGLHQLRAGRALIDLVPVGSKLGGARPPDAERGNMAHFCLRIHDPDWDALGAHLQAHGIPFRPPETRYGADGHGPSIYVADPEGNVVELKGDGAGERGGARRSLPPGRGSGMPGQR